MVNLLSPLEINGLGLRNRIVLPPMETEKATSDGEVTEDLKEHYSKRAEAVGLTIIEHCYVSKEGKFDKKQLGIYRDELIPDLNELVELIHEAGSPVILQISHAGKSIGNRDIELKPVGPSESENCRKLSKEEIKKIAEDFAEATNRAVKAGFDGVEIHGAHGFLLNQFYSPLTNKREDEYGGSFKERIKFPLEVLEKVKRNINDKKIFYRLGSTDLDSNGTKIEESKKFAKILVNEGADVIDISGGICGSRPKKITGKQGYFIPQATKIKKEIDNPVIGVGGIKTPEYANKVIKKRLVDLVAVGREQLKDPNWANKAIESIK